MAGAEREPTILAINSGSSSLKFGLYSAAPSGMTVVMEGRAESTGPAGEAGSLRIVNSDGIECMSEDIAFISAAETLARLGGFFAERRLSPPAAIGHRIVHGGPQLHAHCVIDANVSQHLEAAAAFAPLHMPAALAAIRRAQSIFPGVPQVACLDTAFHDGLPDVSRVLPLSRALEAEGIRRYGFHGVACESIVRRFGEDLPKRVVIAHLGSGASITAIEGGRSVDTSMGLTPAGGTLMGTRCGDVDPGVLIWLGRNKGLGYDDLEKLVNRDSGLLGISELAGDMRSLRAAAADNASARLAIQMFCYSVRKQIAAMVAVLRGIDLLVFTGGIGENDSSARAEICGGLAWAGIDLDAERNRTAADPVSRDDAYCTVRVVPAAEESEIARQTWQRVSQVV